MIGKKIKIKIWHGGETHNSQSIAYNLSLRRIHRNCPEPESDRNSGIAAHHLFFSYCAKW